MKFQFVRSDHTIIRHTEGGERVKVVEGEIIESDREPGYFLLNGFREFKEIEVKARDDGKKNITVSVKKGRKPKK